MLLVICGFNPSPQSCHHLKLEQKKSVSAVEGVLIGHNTIEIVQEQLILMLKLCL